MNAKAFPLVVTVLAVLAFVGALGGRQVRGEDSFGLLWMVGAALAAVALIALKVHAFEALLTSPWWFAIVGLCCLIGALLIVTIAPLAWIGGAIAGIGIAALLLKLVTTTSAEGN